MSQCMCPVGQPVSGRISRGGSQGGSVRWSGGRTACCSILGEKNCIAL